MSAVLFASFETEEALMAAAAAAREGRYRLIDTFTPYPVVVAGSEPTNGPDERKLAWVVATVGLATCALVYGFEWLTAVHAYPFNAGGRPLNSWPVFLLAPFELGVLAAAIAGFASFLVLCGLPRLNHPAFDNDAIDRAGRDRFVLALAAPEDADGRKALTDLLDGASSIEEGEL